MVTFDPEKFVKLQVEEFMKNNLENYLILRLSKTYSRNLEEHSIFAEIFLRLKKKKKVMKVVFCFKWLSFFIILFSLNNQYISIHHTNN